MAKITSVHAIEILDSRGNPTVETEIKLDDGSEHKASVPSGASVGKHEAAELRDGDHERYNGKGVLKAVENVNTIIQQALTGKEPNPREVDKTMLEIDGTTDKSKLGANSMLSVSLATCRAAAHVQNLPLWKFLNGYYFKDTSVDFPRLMVNVVNGGVHANWNFDIQEFILVPNSMIPSEALRLASEVYHSIGESLKEKGLSLLVGDEGGYSPALSSNEQALELISDAAKKAGYENVKDYRLSVDCAASEFYKDAKYHLKKEGKDLTGDQLTSYYSEIGQKFFILSFEDAFAEDDWAYHKAFADMAERFKFVTIGDDLFTTNPVRIKKGIEEKAANGVLIKPNQIGTVTETVEAIKLAQEAHWKVAISHRSGETEDSFIADLAFACGADFLKSGATSRSERLAKYNRLIEIENQTRE